MKLRSGGLTEKEKLYLEYFLKNRWKRVWPVVCVLGIGAIVCIVLIFSGYNTLYVTCPTVFLVIGWSFSMKYILSGKEIYDYIMLGCAEIFRTNIEKKYRCWDRRHFNLHYDGNERFFCVGLPDAVMPVSADAYRLAKVGDEITVVRIKNLKIIVGITFHEKYDKKIHIIS